MSNWFGGKKQQPAAKAAPAEAAEPLSGAIDLGATRRPRKDATQTVFGGKSQRGKQALGQSQYADLARKTLLGQ